MKTFFNFSQRKLVLKLTRPILHSIMLILLKKSKPFLLKTILLQSYIATLPQVRQQKVLLVIMYSVMTKAVFRTNLHLNKIPPIIDVDNILPANNHVQLDKASASTQASTILCQGYLHATLKGPVWLTYPFQIFSLHPTAAYIFYGSFHAPECHQSNFYLAGDYVEVFSANSCCLNLKYYASLKKIVQ